MADVSDWEEHETITSTFYNNLIMILKYILELKPCYVKLKKYYLSMKPDIS